eukprot:scaffold206981_cov16-Tisochrysis_lutea.AAC.1
MQKQYHSAKEFFCFGLAWKRSHLERQFLPFLALRRSESSHSCTPGQVDENNTRAFANTYLFDGLVWGGGRVAAACPFNCDQVGNVMLVPVASCNASKRWQSPQQPPMINTYTSATAPPRRTARARLAKKEGTASGLNIGPNGLDSIPLVLKALMTGQAMLKT